MNDLMEIITIEDLFYGYEEEDEKPFNPLGKKCMMGKIPFVSQIMN